MTAYGLPNKRSNTRSTIGGWVALAGCATFLIGIVLVVVMATGRAFPLVLAVAVVVALLGDAARRWYLHVLGRRFRREHSGRDLLLVYTDSPHWKEYIESKWVARWRGRTVTLNRSHPWSRKQPEAALWLAVAGITDHTPMAIVVPPRGKIRVITFFAAFRDFKHGKEQRLRAAEQELENAIQASAAAGA